MLTLLSYPIIEERFVLKSCIFVVSISSIDKLKQYDYKFVTKSVVFTNNFFANKGLKIGH